MSFKTKTKATTKNKKKQKKVNKFTKDHVPEDVKGTKKAFEVHLCLVAVIDSIDFLPPPPTLEQKREFLKGIGKVNAFLTGNMAKFNIVNKEVNKRMDRLKTEAQSFKHLRKEVLRVPQEALCAICASFVRLGIECIRVDAMGDSSSMYNAVMKRIAIRMFQLAIGCRGYIDHGIVDTYWSDDAWLDVLFDYYFFEHLERKQKREEKRPGQLLLDRSNANFKRRAMR
ncbi:hypothetical protein AAF712_016456, partial [Marasmius tenuissimus]